MASPRFCLFVPSESTHSPEVQAQQKRGAHHEVPGPFLNRPAAEALPWVVKQSVCLEGLWCVNVIPGANTGLLTSEGCGLLWMLPSGGEAHFDDSPHL